MGSINVDTFSLFHGEWLTINRTLPYSRCSHFEYVEDPDQRSRIANDLRQMIVEHYASSRNWLQLIESAGFPALAKELRDHALSFPARTTKSTRDGKEVQLTTRSGDFCEMLATEFAIKQMGFEVLVRRLRYNPNRNQSMKGDDLLGFRFQNVHGEAAILVGEAKYRSSSSSSTVIDTVRAAHESLQRSRRSYPASMDFVANVIEASQDQQRAGWIRQMRALLRFGRMPVARHYLIFLATVGQPPDPFRWLEKQQEVLPNLTCVNIVFAPNFQTWLDELFEELTDGA